MSTELRYMPCDEFETAIHEFVDNELSKADSKALLVHLELCDPCRISVEAVRNQIRVDRESPAFEGLADAFDRNAFFKKLNGTLLAGHLGRLGELLYELGKAYFIAGNDSKLRTFIHKKAVSIQRAQAEGRRVASETSTLLQRSGGASRNTQERVTRSSRLFGSGPKSPRLGERSGRNALDNARRFLEESLILDPKNARARLYLGVYYHRVDRPDKAAAEYRKILAMPELDRTIKAMTLQALGNSYAYRRAYDKAARTFEEILDLGVVEDDPRFFTVLLSLAMFQAKLERFERSQELFGRLVETYPDKLGEAREILGQADVFSGLLRSNAGFRAELEERYPVLFVG